MILDLRKKKVNKNIKCPHCEIEYKPADIASSLKKGYYTCPACEGKIPATLNKQQKGAPPPSPGKKYLVPVLIVLGIVAMFAIIYHCTSAEKTTKAVPAVAPAAVPASSSAKPAKAVPTPAASAANAVPVVPEPQADLPTKQLPDKMQIAEKIAIRLHKNYACDSSADFACLDMAVSIWNQLLTNGIESKIMAGNIRENISSWNFRQLVTDSNRAWVVARLNATEKIAVDTTTGTIIKPGMRNASAYFRGIEFDNPGQIKSFEILRTAFKNVCADADRVKKDWNENVAGKQLKPEETIAKKSRMEQRKQDCENTFTDLKEYESRAIYY